MTDSKNRVDLKSELKAKTDYLVSRDEELFANLSKTEITKRKKERAKIFRNENKALLDENKKTRREGHKDSKEALPKSLEFENDTFKIDTVGWKEEQKMLILFLMVP